MNKVLIISYGESKRNGGVASLCDFANAAKESGCQVTFLSPFAKFDRLIYRSKILSKEVQRKGLSYREIDKPTYLHRGIKIWAQHLSTLLFGSVNYEDYDLIIDGIGLQIQTIKQLKRKQVLILRNHAGSPAAFYNHFFRPDRATPPQTRIDNYVEIMRNYSGGLFQAHSHLEEFQKHTGLNPSSCLCIPPTVDKTFDTFLQDNKQVGRDPYKLIMLGSIQRRKGQKHALLLLKELNNVTETLYSLEIVGNILEKEYFKELQQLAHDLGVSEQVCFVGFSNDYILNLATSSCMLQMSEAEGIPRAVRESLAVNVPVIGFHFSNSCTEITRHNGGFFVEDASITSLVTAIKTSVPFMNARNAYDNLFARELYVKQIQKRLPQLLRR